MDLPGETIGRKISNCFPRGGVVPVFLRKSTAICDFSEEEGGPEHCPRF